jgi:hypothetical protein
MNNNIFIIIILTMINFGLNFYKVYDDKKNVINNIKDNKIILIYSFLFVLLSSSILFL